MTDDLLRRASSALRDETAEADEGGRFTRARVMASLQQSVVRRRARLAVLLPLAACFAAATAWGTVNGNARTFWDGVVRILGFTEERAATPAPGATRSKPLPAPGLKAPATETAPPRSESAKEIPPRAEPRAEPRAAREKPRAMSAESAPGVTDADPAHELYRAAHRAHFVAHDFSAALAAWNAYLGAAPSGRFALEARYNRALCLVRLGRASEARAALEPFASGSFGAYRREEARALIDALARDTGSP